MKENSNEIWKDIKGYEGLYQVSNFGRVKSLNYNRTQNEKILKPGNDCLGYYRISLSKCGKAKTKAIHRQVKKMFEVTYSMEGIIRKIMINASDAVQAQSIFTNLYGLGKVQIINIRRV